MGAPRQRLLKLASLESTYPHILSAYFRLRDGGKDRLKSARIFLKQRASEIADVLANDAKARTNLAKEVARVERYLEQEVPQNAAGVALFVMNGEVFEKFETPVGMENQVAYRRVPHIAPLAHIQESLESFLIVALDSRSARIFDVAMGASENRAEINNEVHQRIHAGGMSQLRYQRRVSNQKREHLEEVAEHLEALVRELKISRILVVGTDRNTARFLELLPAAIAKRVIDRARVESNASETELVDLAVEYMLKADDAEESERIRRTRIEIHSSRMAVAGINNVLRYLNSGQAYEVMLAHDFNESGVECSRCGAVTHSVPQLLTSCPSCDADAGALKGVVLRELMTRRALNYGIKLHFMKSPEFRQILGNAAAMLHSPHA